MKLLRRSNDDCSGLLLLLLLDVDGAFLALLIFKRLFC
jgi:hypothetical protein